VDQLLLLSYFPILYLLAIVGLHINFSTVRQALKKLTLPLTSTVLPYKVRVTGELLIPKHDEMFEKFAVRYGWVLACAIMCLKRHFRLNEFTTESCSKTEQQFITTRQQGFLFL
jgi:hypothetical protein